MPPPTSGKHRAAPIPKVVTLKIVDRYQFKRVVTIQEAIVINKVEDRVKENSRLWWATEASRGAAWYLSPDLAGAPLKDVISEKDVYSSFWGSSFGQRESNEALIKKLARKGIPPQLRPKIYRLVSGAMKKMEAAPMDYYAELLHAVEAKETPATRQIDNVLIHTSVPMFNPTSVSHGVTISLVSGSSRLVP